MNRAGIRFWIIASSFVVAASIHIGGANLVGAQETESIEGQLPLPSSLLALNSDEGRRLLRQSKSQEPFWTLVQNYETQQDLGSCSVASCVMVLNAMGVQGPVSPSIHPFRRHTAANLFNEDVERVISQSTVSKVGMSLLQLREVVGTFPVTSHIVYAGDSDVSQFRRDLKEHLARPEQQMVNYFRKSLGQQGGGHISPVAAYNEESDMVLIADTAGYKYPWTWVPVSLLWVSMASFRDHVSGKTRGYLVVVRTANRQ